MIPKGMTLKSARGKLPPVRSGLQLLTRTRFLLAFFLCGLVIIFWRSFSGSAANMQKFYCFGPAKSPMEITPNENEDWHASQRTPVLFNPHEPLVVEAHSIDGVNLNPIRSTGESVRNKERILILTPLRLASRYLEKHFELLLQLTYPHELIDLAFLISDSPDDTKANLVKELDRIQKGPSAFRSVKIIEKDFGLVESQDVDVRHSFAFQGPRRKSMGRARNYLLYSALGPDHSWVYWRDVDIVDSPKKILEDLTAHDKDIIVPNIWFHRYEDDRDIEGRFDYNSWQESDQGLALAARLPKDTVLAEGYKEYDTGRKYMALMGDWRSDKDDEIELDGIGGVSILVKADVHRSGINFPAYSFENQAETEGFAKMAKRAGYKVIGLPNYVVWHIDTQERPGNAF